MSTYALNHVHHEATDVHAAADVIGTMLLHPVFNRIFPVPRVDEEWFKLHRSRRCNWLTVPK